MIHRKILVVFIQLLYQLVGEVKMEKSIQALDTTFGGRMAAMAGSSAEVILTKME
jgi:hypothetical protein